MADPRINEYARLLVERCLDVQPGWQVVIVGDPLARPLVQAAIYYIARRGAYALPRLAPTALLATWLKNAPREMIDTPAPIDEYWQANMDAYLSINAPENTREGSDIPADRYAAYRRSRQTYIDRVMKNQFPWVACNFPTQSLAQDANITLDGYTDFLYTACLLDWDALAATMRQRADRFDSADEVRIIGTDTDLTLSLKGRHGRVDDGHLNMPGGEFFYSPVEDSAEGYITYGEFPVLYANVAVEGARLEFHRGKVVNASARTNEAYLLKTLDSDEGARYLGELGIGCNYGIQQHMRDTLFDEKINGTIHLAVGGGFPEVGGTNVSLVHWDMVKDLRRGGKLLLDGVPVQENGEWLI